MIVNCSVAPNKNKIICIVHENTLKQKNRKHTVEMSLRLRSPKVPRKVAYGRITSNNRLFIAVASSPSGTC